MTKESENLQFSDYEHAKQSSTSSGARSEFDVWLNQFLGIKDPSKSKSSKLLLQIVLLLEVLIDKMICVDKFKTMHIISKLKLKGEEVSSFIEEFDKINYFTGKGINLYFKLLQLLTKSEKETKPKILPIEIKEPGIHVSGTFEDYLK